MYLFVGRSNALVACRHQIGRTEIRNVDVQCTSASSEVKLDRQSFLHLTSGFFFGYLPCPSSDCPMHGKKKKLKAHHRHTRHLVIPTSPPRSLEKSSEERASFGAQLGSQSALVKIHDFRNSRNTSKQSTPKYRNRNLSYLRFFQSWSYCEMNTS